MSEENNIQFYQDAKGEWRWRVRADNGNVVGDSGEGYKNLGDAIRGLQALGEFLVRVTVKGGA